MRQGSLTATVTHVCTIEYVAKMPGEDQELLEAIVCNDDNLTYGTIVSVYTGTDEAITALTDDGISEIKDMLAAARRSTKEWHDFLQDFVADPDIIAASRTNTRHRTRRISLSGERGTPTIRRFVQQSRSQAGLCLESGKCAQSGGLIAGGAGWYRARSRGAGCKARRVACAHA